MTLQLPLHVEPTYIFKKMYCRGNDKGGEGVGGGLFDIKIVEFKGGGG